MEGTYLTDQLTTPPMGWEDLQISSSILYQIYGFDMKVLFLKK